MAMDFCSGVAVMNVCFFVGALCKRTWRWKRLNCYVAACAVMVVWFFVGALCKRPWRWKRLNVLLQLALRSSWPCHVSLRGIAPAPQCKEKYLLTILSFWHVATLILVDFSHKRTRI